MTAAEADIDDGIKRKRFRVSLKKLKSHVPHDQLCITTVYNEHLSNEFHSRNE